jgi:glycosyltransferase involved in cell wall biosynthesis
MSAIHLRGKWRQWRRWRELREARLAVLAPWLLTNRKTQIFSLDERIMDPRLSRVPRRIADRIEYLSDPAPVRATSVAESPVGAKETNLLLVGSQSARKGLPGIIRLCNQFPVERLGVRFTLIGRLTQETEHLRPQLKKHANLISWTDEYVSEQQIATAYDLADYVVLPYTRDFSGSSGVLGSAVAHEKPVIASDHGLVGHRVLAHGLGITYPAHDLEQLWKQLSVLPDPRCDRSYSKWVTNISKYAPLISEQNHINKLVNTLQKSA